MFEKLIHQAGVRVARGCIRINWALIRAIRKSADRQRAAGQEEAADGMERIAADLAQVTCRAEVELAFC